MLGDQIGDESGQITGLRVLPGKDGPKVEVSFQTSGTLLGVHENNMGTYVSARRPDGTLFGEGQGIMATEQGDMISWRGQGVGRFTGHGTGVSWRGAMYFQTSSERLARLNGTVGVYEYESNESGKAETKTYEWK
jgi:hypothetical protein